MSDAQVKRKDFYQLGDNVHNPMINRTGFVICDNGDSVTVRAVDGQHTWDKTKIEFIDNNEFNDDV